MGTAFPRVALEIIPDVNVFALVCGCKGGLFRAVKCYTESVMLHD